MSGDYSRLTFKPSRNAAGAFIQQGRVTSDADLNENVQIHERRRRAEAVDQRGRSWVGGETPNAFRVASDLSVAPGRLYVDGLLAENHGADPLDTFDATLDERRSVRAVPVAEQPYRLDLEAPSAEGARTDLVYLDVWQREVTALQDEDIREKALGGPDTATRLQTVWQVRVLEGVGSIGCGGSVDDWDALLRPPAGRLTTSVAAEGTDAPCLVPPAAGYTGLENQLYRVEIHTPGPLGSAQFKWSRDNASVYARVESVSGTEVTVSTVGRDAVLRFETNDWVEILDDALELEGRAGFLVRVADVDPASRRVTLESAVPPSFGIDPTRPERNTRVRRWDGATADGLVPATAAPQLLEHGIHVAFAADGGDLRTGDYWIFAARAVDGTIELLVDAPPRGVHHHYCRLALVEYADGEVAAVSDCRPRETDGDCDCCNLVVRPGESIQAAIDSLPDEGGSVCLKPGLHSITETIRISRSNVTLHGETRGAQIERQNGHALLTIEGGGGQIENVSVRSLQLATRMAVPDPLPGDLSDVLTEGGGPLLTISEAARVRVEDCLLEQRAVASVEAGGRRLRIPMPAFGIRVHESTEVAFTGNTLAELTMGIWSETSTGVSATANVMRGPVAEGLQDRPIVLGISGIGLRDDANPRVEGNRIDDYAAAVNVEGVERGNVVVRGNRIGEAGADDRGRATADGVGIVVGGSTLVTLSGLDVSHNRIRNDAGRWGIVCASVRGGRIHGNSVSHGSGGILLDDCEDETLFENDVRGAESGIALFAGARLNVVGNRVRESSFAGLRGVDVEGLRVAESLFQNCGSQQLGPLESDETAAVYLGPAPGAVAVESCRILDAGVDASLGTSAPVPVHALVVRGPSVCSIRGNDVSSAATRSEGGPADLPLIVQVSKSRSLDTASLDISSNRIVVQQAPRLVDVQPDDGGQLFDRVIFAGNECARDAAPGADPIPGAAVEPAVTLTGQRVVIANNHVSGSQGKAIECPRAGPGARGGERTVLGNVVTGGLEVLGRAVVPADIAGFNIMI